jgi:septal ring factor EnvC (AmiA/AmiB activator)
MKPRVTITSLQQDLAARERHIDHLGRELAETRAQLAGAHGAQAQAETKLREEFNRRVDALREDKAALKGLLAEAYEQLARHEGYMTRVLEDDVVREVGPTSQERPAEPVVQPSDGGYVDRNAVGYTSRRAPAGIKPWHSI